MWPALAYFFVIASRERTFLYHKTKVCIRLVNNKPYQKKITAKGTLLEKTEDDNLLVDWYRMRFNGSSDCIFLNTTSNGKNDWTKSMQSLMIWSWNVFAKLNITKKKQKFFTWLDYVKPDCFEQNKKSLLINKLCLLIDSVMITVAYIV